jgi:hypothetical protein
MNQQEHEGILFFFDKCLVSWQSVKQ